MFIVLLEDSDTKKRGIILTEELEHDYPSTGYNYIKHKKINLSKDDMILFRLYEMIKLGSNCILIEKLMDIAYEMGKEKL